MLASGGPRRPGSAPSAPQEPCPRARRRELKDLPGFAPGPRFLLPTPLDTCVIWPCTQRSLTWASPTLLPLPPGLGVPLPNAHFPSVSSVFYASARRCPSKRAGRGQSPPLHLLSLGKSPFLPGGNARGRGQKEADQEEAAGGGGDTPSPQSHHPPGSPQRPPDSGHTAGVAPRTGGATASAGLAGRRESKREGPESGSWKARAGVAPRSAVGLVLQPPRPPFCPKES